jgi:ribulose-bisphosphate carboxylase large chain
VGYFDLNYTPSGRDLVCDFYYEVEGISHREAAERIAAESSIGTWTDITTMKEEIKKQLMPRIFYHNEELKRAKIAYPQELFEGGNMPQILSSIAGNVFGLKEVTHLRLMDVSFPRDIVESFQGPRFGVEGIRRITRIKDRPLLGTIIKPKLGLDSKEHARVAYEAWVGGVDIVKDDENLADMKFNSFSRRITETLKMRDKAESLTGEKKIYMPNITSETQEMLSRAVKVKENGGEYVMVDILTAGWAALQTLRNADLDLVIHAHRAGHAALTRRKRHGISMTVIAKVARLIGVDQLHIGTFGVGKMIGSPKEDLEYKEALEGEMFGIKPVLAVASGGLHPGVIDELIKIAGKDIVIQAGGGIHGHRGGTRSGARAMRQAIRATLEGVSLGEYARDHEELRIALEQWAPEKL